MDENTPFDEICGYDLTKFSDGRMKLGYFAGIFRVLYLNMVEARTNLDKLHNNAEHRSEIKKFELNDPYIRNKLSYFTFCSQIAILGELLSLFPKPPLYNRIKFFRNKVVAHWSEYWVKSPQQMMLVGAIGGKIFIPYHFNKIIDGHEAKPTLAKLNNCFIGLGVNNEITRDDWYGDYSEKIFLNLEQIDPQLLTSFNKKNQKIPEDLIELLFHYSFPSPITDMEKYTSDFIGWYKTDLQKTPAG